MKLYISTLLLVVAFIGIDAIENIDQNADMDEVKFCIDEYILDFIAKCLTIQVKIDSAKTDEERCMYENIRYKLFHKLMVEKCHMSEDVFNSNIVPNYWDNLPFPCQQNVTEKIYKNNDEDKIRACFDNNLGDFIYIDINIRTGVRAFKTDTERCMFANEGLELYHRLIVNKCHISEDIFTNTYVPLYWNDLSLSCQQNVTETVPIKNEEDEMKLCFINHFAEYASVFQKLDDDMNAAKTDEERCIVADRALEICHNLFINKCNISEDYFTNTFVPHYWNGLPLSCQKNATKNVDKNTDEDQIESCLNKNIIEMYSILLNVNAVLYDSMSEIQSCRIADKELKLYHNLIVNKCQISEEIFNNTFVRRYWKNIPFSCQKNVTEVFDKNNDKSGIKVCFQLYVEFYVSLRYAIQVKIDAAKTDEERCKVANEGLEYYHNLLVKTCQVPEDIFTNTFVPSYWNDLSFSCQQNVTKKVYKNKKIGLIDTCSKYHKEKYAALLAHLMDALRSANTEEERCNVAQDSLHGLKSLIVGDCHVSEEIFDRTYVPKFWSSIPLECPTKKPTMFDRVLKLLN